MTQTAKKTIPRIDVYDLPMLNFKAMLIRDLHYLWRILHLPHFSPRARLQALAGRIRSAGRTLETPVYSVEQRRYRRTKITAEF